MTDREIPAIARAYSILAALDEQGQLRAMRYLEMRLQHEMDDRRLGAPA